MRRRIDHMSNIKKLAEDIYVDYKSEVFTIEQLADKYDVSLQFVLDAIDLFRFKARVEG